MTTEEKVARRQLSQLELAQDLGNASKAYKVMGYSRQQFYEIRRNFQTHGSEGLIDRLPGGGYTTSKMPVTAVHILNNDVLPSNDEDKPSGLGHTNPQ